MNVAMMDTYKKELKTWNLLVALEICLHLIGMTVRNIEDTNYLGIQTSLSVSGVLLYPKGRFLKLEI